MDTEHARQLLAAARERVEQGLAGTDPGLEVNDNDAVTGVDEALAETLTEELAAIERAEQRLAEGTYGLSIESGDPIPDARLEAVPWVERTVEEQSRYEQGA